MQNYIVHFAIRVTNLDPAPVDTCFFQNEYEVNLKPDQITGIEYSERIPISFYPNPCSGQLYTTGTKIKNFTMFASDGKIILKSENPPSVLNLNIAPGLYFIRLESNTGETITNKLVIN